MVKNIQVDTFKSMMAQANVVVVDVRSIAEKAEGDIPGCIHIDIFSPDFASRIAQLNKDKTYLMFCRSGGRSGNAATYMLQQGFAQVYNLEGGIMAWNRAQSSL